MRCQSTVLWVVAIGMCLLPSPGFGQQNPMNAARVSDGEDSEESREEREPRRQRNKESRQESNHRTHRHHHHHRRHSFGVDRSGPVARLFGPGDLRRDDVHFEFERVWVSHEPTGLRVDYEVARSSWELCHGVARGVYLTVFVKNEYGYKFRHAVPLAVRRGDARFYGGFGVKPDDKVGIGVVVVGPLVGDRTLYPGYIVHRPTILEVHSKRSRLKGESVSLELDFYRRMNRFSWYSPGYGFN